LKGIEIQDPALQAMLCNLAEENGFNLSEILDGTIPGADLESVPELPVEPITTPGDLILLGHHRLLCGDATRSEDLLRLMDGAHADMVWTDPPYNVAYEGKTQEALTIQNDSMDSATFKAFLLAFYIAALAVTKGGGPIYVAHADSEGLNFRAAMQEAGWLLKQCLIWVKQSFVLGRQDYHWQHEPILYGWAPGAAHVWEGDRTQSTTLHFDRPSRSEDHPTMKPVDLAISCVVNSGPPNDPVFGPCDLVFLVLCNLLRTKYPVLGSFGGIWHHPLGRREDRAVRAPYRARPPLLRRDRGPLGASNREQGPAPSRDRFESLRIENGKR